MNKEFIKTLNEKINNVARYILENDSEELLNNEAITYILINIVKCKTAIETLIGEV